MQLFLNAVWVLLAAAGICACCRYELGLNRSPREFSRALLAAVTIAVFAFPAISATDDLRAAQAVVEEPGAQKRLCSVSQVMAGHAADMIYATAAALPSQARPHLVARLAFDSTATPSQNFVTHPLDGRSPPTSVL